MTQHRLELERNPYLIRVRYPMLELPNEMFAFCYAYCPYGFIPFQLSNLLARVEFAFEK